MIIKVQEKCEQNEKHTKKNKNKHKNKTQNKAKQKKRSQRRPNGNKTQTKENADSEHMMQHIIAKHLDLNEGLVRIVSRDVGGSFGIKVHVYPDEMAATAISKKIGRPVKFIADRLESFTTDIHARCHKISGKLGVDKNGKILVYRSRLPW